jgi:uncharacterized protein (TIGR03083 family)
MDLFDQIAAERREFADLVDELTEEQLRTPSLCGDWTVRDVAGHLLMPLVTPLRTILAAMVRARGNFDRANSAMARRVAEQPVPTIASALRERAGSHFTPPGFGPIAPLTDLQIHGQDVRRPIGVPREFDPARLTASLDFLMTPRATRAFVAKGRVDGLRFVADDFDWSSGDGPLVRGPGEALLMAISGRTVALGELTGDGVAVLAGRR